MVAFSRPQIHIRWLINRDMPAVLEIERQSFEFAWTAEDFRRARLRNGCVCMVALVDGQIAGYFVFEHHPTRFHIIAFAVAKQYRRRGVGRAMVENLAGRMKVGRREKVMLEVRETNLSAQKFFRACGFVATCIIRGMYEDSDEEAYQMVRYHDPSLDEVEDFMVVSVPR